MDSSMSPQAFRQSLEDRLRNIAINQGVDIQRLRRRVAFERLLARLFNDSESPWILKGGYSLELRLHEHARSTIDLDISILHDKDIQSIRSDQDDIAYIEHLYDLLQQAAMVNIDDHFVYYIERPKRIGTVEELIGFKCSVQSRLAGRMFAQFRLDVGVCDAVLHPTDLIQASDLMDDLGFPSISVAVYPLSFVFAEKIHAYTYPWTGRVNTRVKDLVDLVLLLEMDKLRADQCREALQTVYSSRSSQKIPAILPYPPAEWKDSFAELARELDLSVRNLDEAFDHLNSVWHTWQLGKSFQ